MEKIGVEKHLVEEADNKNFVPYGIETSLGTRYANLSNKVIYTQFDVIRKMAKSSCVIIGRCSDYILKGQDDVVNVFVYAPTEVRIKTIMEKMNLSERHAAEVIRDYDNASIAGINTSPALIAATVTTATCWSTAASWAGKRRRNSSNLSSKCVLKMIEGV